MSKSTNQHPTFARAARLSGVAAGLLVCGTLACSSDSSPDEPIPIPIPGAGAGANNELILAFSGGGYHALAGGASWLMGMMERNPGDKVADVTRNVDLVSSNSGGSWLMGLTMYSPTFLTELEKSGAYQNFAAPTTSSTPGYMTNVWKYISKPTGGCDAWKTSLQRGFCKALAGILQGVGMDGFGNFIISGEGQWETVIMNAVYGDDPGWPYFGEVNGKLLSADRNPWAEGKDWTLAGTLLTQDPALTFTTSTSTYFTGVQTLEATQSASPHDPLVGGTPLMLTSAPGMDFIPGGDVSLQYGTWICTKGPLGCDAFALTYTFKFVQGKASSDCYVASPMAEFVARCVA